MWFRARSRHRPHSLSPTPHSLQGVRLIPTCARCGYTAASVYFRTRRGKTEVVNIDGYDLEVPVKVCLNTKECDARRKAQARVDETARLAPRNGKGRKKATPGKRPGRQKAAPAKATRTRAPQPARSRTTSKQTARSSRKSTT